MVVLRSGERYGRTQSAEFIDSMRRSGSPVLADLRWARGGAIAEGVLARIRDLRPDGVLLWGNGDDMGRVVRALRAAGLAVPILGPDRMVSEAFLREAGDAAEGCVAAYPYDPGRDDPRWKGFRERFRARHGREPDAYAAYALTVAMAEYEGACYMRTHRPDVPLLYAADTPFELGGFHVLAGGEDLALVLPAQPVEEADNVVVAPHPAWKALEIRKRVARGPIRRLSPDPPVGPERVRPATGGAIGNHGRVRWQSRISQLGKKRRDCFDRRHAFGCRVEHIRSVREVAELLDQT